MRASSALKLKRSRSLTSAMASPYLSAHSATARGKIRAGSRVACAVISRARAQACAGEVDRTSGGRGLAARV